MTTAAASQQASHVVDGENVSTLFILAYGPADATATHRLSLQ